MTQPFPPPASHQQPKRKAPRWFKIVLGVFTFLVVIICIAAACGGRSPHPATGHRGTPPTQPAQTAPAAPPASHAVPSAPVAPRTPTQLLRVSGGGIKNSDIFTTQGEWSLTYSYDCSDNFTGQGNFIVSEFTNGTETNLIVNTIGTSGKDTNPIHDDAGTHYLQINSECDWTVTATG